MVPRTLDKKKGNRVNDSLKNQHFGIFLLKPNKSMKKIKSFGELFHCSLKKILLIMRFAIILLIIAVMQANASDVYSQKTRLSINFTNTKLVSVLDKIEVESEFFFLYNEKLLDTERKVSIEAKN